MSDFETKSQADAVFSLTFSALAAIVWKEHPEMQRKCPVGGRMKKDDRMDSKDTFYTGDRNEWRKWLSENFETKKEIWFVFPTKASGETALSYNDAVEEALCFGWIDSTAGRLDDTHGLRRFTPRKDFSYYSRPNIERLIRLDEQGMIHPKVRPTVAGLIEAEYVFPEDILDAIRADDVAWQNFLNFSEPYKRIRVAYIDAARKRPEEFKKRLAAFLAKTRANRLIVGFGGIDKYYE